MGTLDYDQDGNPDLLYQLVGSSMQEVGYFNGTSWHGRWLHGTGIAPDALAALPGGNEGTDTVLSSISFTLPGGVENLTPQSGAGSINGTGNALDNVIIGNEGNNVLSGLAGRDTFVFKPNFAKDVITDFHPGEDILQFDHTMFTSASDAISHTTAMGMR